MTKPFDTEFYRGYSIVLPTSTWDEMFQVRLDGKLLKEFPDRLDARRWVDEQIATSRRTS